MNFDLPRLVTEKTKEVAIQGRLPSVGMMSVQHFPLYHNRKSKRKEYILHVRAALFQKAERILFPELRITNHWGLS